MSKNSRTPYKNALYGILKISPKRTAIALLMDRFPLSISDIQFWVVPNFSASSCCVHSILPRKPRKAIAGQASGKASSALTTSSPSASKRRTLYPANVIIPLIASATITPLAIGTAKEMIACPLSSDWRRNYKSVKPPPLAV